MSPVQFEEVRPPDPAEVARRLGVVPPPDITLPPDVRPKDFAPDVPLRLATRPFAGGPTSGGGADASEDARGLRWQLNCCHRAGDASTANVYRGRLAASGGGPGRAVVLKVRRGESPELTDEATAARFSEELRAVQELERATAGRPALTDTVPHLWGLDGLKYDGREPIRLSPPGGGGRPLYFCLAARHALRGRPHPRFEDRFSLPFGDDPACAECGVLDLPAGDRPAACRRWAVAVGGRQLPDEAQRLPATQALIATDRGPTVKQDIRATEAGEAKADAAATADALWRKLEGLTDLARRMADVHAAGLLHLDLNLDNVCVADGREGNDRGGAGGEGGAGVRVRPIDFGQSEPADAAGQGGLVADRRVAHRDPEFLSPRMRSRVFELDLGVESVDDGEVVAGGSDLRGWGSDRFPLPGDRLLTNAVDPPDVAGGGGRSARRTAAGIELILTHVGRPKAGRVRFTFRRDGDDGRPLRSVFGLGDRLTGRLVRRATPRDDVYAFGLLAACWVLDLRRPGIVRDELSVAKRVLPRTLSSDGGRSRRGFWGLAASDFWSHYREAVSTHSALLDEALRSHAERAAAARSPADQVLAARGVALVREMLRVAALCVIDDPPGGLPDGDAAAAGFRRVVAALEALRRRLLAGDAGDPAEAALPMSWTGYQREVLLLTESGPSRKSPADLAVRLKVWRKQFVSVARELRTADADRRRAGATINLARTAADDGAEQARRFVAAYRGSPLWRKVWWEVSAAFRPPGSPTRALPDATRDMLAALEIARESLTGPGTGDADGWKRDVADLRRHLERAAALPRRADRRRFSRRAVRDAEVLGGRLGDTGARLHETDHTLGPAGRRAAEELDRLRKKAGEIGREHREWVEAVAIHRDKFRQAHGDAVARLNDRDAANARGMFRAHETAAEATARAAGAATSAHTAFTRTLGTLSEAVRGGGRVWKRARAVDQDATLLKRELFAVAEVPGVR